MLLSVVFCWQVGAFFFFGFYLLFHIVGNVLLVGSVRPMVPFLVGRGCQTAVALGLSILTVFQFGGEWSEREGSSFPSLSCWNFVESPEHRSRLCRKIFPDCRQWS